MSRSCVGGSKKISKRKIASESVPCATRLALTTYPLTYPPTYLPKAVLNHLPTHLPTCLLTLTLTLTLTLRWACSPYSPIIPNPLPKMGLLAVLELHLDRRDAIDIDTDR